MKKHLLLQKLGENLVYKFGKNNISIYNVNVLTKFSLTFPNRTTHKKREENVDLYCAILCILYHNLTT